MQIATSGRAEYFGEASLSKVPKSSTSVIAHSTVTVLVLHKWDVLNTLDTSLAAELARYSVAGAIDEELLVQQFYRCARATLRALLLLWHWLLGHVLGY
jgi:hypothetical protein